ncbi:MAG: RHS repeat-associated core domain-containing protein [Pirellula sp.]
MTAEIGTVAIVLTATDLQGGVAVQSIQIDVRAANRLPTIRSNPNLKVSQGALYQYDVLATDPDREPLFYSLVTAPAGMAIDALGRIRWQTQLDTPLGGREVVVQVVDGIGGAVTQSFTFGVVPDTLAPRMTIIVGGEPVLYPWTSAPAIVRVIAADDVGLTGVELRVDGKPIELAADGTARVYFSAPGNGRLEAVATDAAGNQGTALARVSMRSGEEDGGGNPAPEATITSITDGVAVSGFVDVIGTAVSPDFERYVLSYRRIDQSIFKTILTSATQVTTGSLGKWDTTLLENDNYVLKLEVFDTFGSFAAMEVEVSVSSNLKLGNFRLSFEDLTIPVAGIPITIVRTYDTLRADRDSDFGYGWRLEYRNTDLRTSLPKSGLEDIGIYTPFKQGTKVFITLPGGKREGFTFTPEIKVLPGFSRNDNLVLASPRFTPDRGVTSTLSVGSGQLIVHEFGEMYAAGGIPWNPASPDFAGYTLTTTDGLQYKIDGSTGQLQTVLDRNGNSLIFTDVGISSSSGIAAVAIRRDVNGRIAAITDPAGHSVRYAYSAAGDLTSINDRTGHVSRLVYRSDRPHFLDSVVDPLGRTGVRTEYGTDGRLIATFDSLGNSVQTSYDPDNQLVTTRDALGNQIAIEYDAAGNLVSMTDALGGISRFTYDGNGNALTSVNTLGGSTRNVYDTLGRRISIEDALGNKSFFTYDSYGNVISTVDALGRTSRSIHDINGNMTRSIDAVGATFEFSYNGGRLTSLNGPGGIALAMQYQNNAYPSQSTDLQGRITTTQFDPNGQPISRSSVVNLTSGPTLVTESTTYDAEGRILSLSDARGVILRNSYDAAGQLTSTTNIQGTKTSFIYDANGRVTETIFADGTRELNVYDANGQLTRTVDPAGRETRFVYDVLGRRVAVIYPDNTPETIDDNPVSRVEYDAAGQVLAEIDPLGFRREYGYDLAGRKTLMRNPLGSETRFVYDAVGNLVTVTDPLDRQTHYVYDEAGRQVETIFEDGSTVRNLLNVQGNPVATIDESGIRITYEQDQAGRNSKVTDALGNTTTYEYENRGLLKKHIDAKSHATTYEYDAFGNETARILPGGEVWRTEYNELNQVNRTVDPNGNVLVFTYDNLARLITKSRSDNVTYRYTYTPAGNLDSIVDARGTTRFNYDLSNRLLSRVEPDGQSLQYTYDLLGRTLTMTTLAGETRYAYDSIGQLTSLTAPNGDVTKYKYNAAGELIQIDNSNGTIETRQYDGRGRLVNKTVTLGTQILSEYKYVLDPTGRVAEATMDGVRLVYAYDAAYRLVSETTKLGPIFYTYDAVGNRLIREAADDRTTYIYDENNRLLQIDSSSGAVRFTFDAAGNQTRRQVDNQNFTNYSWDAENRLERVEISDEAGTRFEQSRYDSAGNRIASITAQGEVRYLLDLNGEFSQVAAEYTPEGVLLASIVRGVNVIGETRQGQSVVFITDRLGSIRAISSSAGAIVARFDYDAYGVQISSDGITSSPQRFTGESRSSLSGIDYLRARYYDPSQGRFLSADPFAGRLIKPVSLHKYQYADLDPVNNRDPSGLFTLAELTTSTAISETLKKSNQVLAVKKANDKKVGLDYLMLAVRIGYSLPMALAFGQVGGPLKTALNLFTYEKPKHSQIAIDKLKIDLESTGGNHALKFGIDTAFGKYDIQAVAEFPFLKGISLAGADATLAEFPSGSKKPVAKVNLATRPLSIKGGEIGLRNFPAKMSIDFDLSLFSMKYSVELLPFLLIVSIEALGGDALKN